MPSMVFLKGWSRTPPSRARLPPALKHKHLFHQTHHASAATDGQISLCYFPGIVPTVGLSLSLSRTASLLWVCWLVSPLILGGFDPTEECRDALKICTKFFPALSPLLGWAVHLTCEHSLCLLNRETLLRLLQILTSITWILHKSSTSSYSEIHWKKSPQQLMQLTAQWAIPTWFSQPVKCEFWHLEDAATPPSLLIYLFSAVYWVQNRHDMFFWGKSCQNSLPLSLTQSWGYPFPSHIP